MRAGVSLENQACAIVVSHQCDRLFGSPKAKLS